MKLNFSSLSLPDTTPQLFGLFHAKAHAFWTKNGIFRESEGTFKGSYCLLFERSKNDFQGSTHVYALFHTDFTFIPNDRGDHPQKTLNHQRYWSHRNKFC